jgi:hypothetical protein
MLILDIVFCVEMRVWMNLIAASYRLSRVAVGMRQCKQKYTMQFAVATTRVRAHVIVSNIFSQC